jgi:hypothetical protein
MGHGAIRTVRAEQASQRAIDRLNDERMGPVLRYGVYLHDGCPKCPVPPPALEWSWHGGFDERNPSDICKVVGEHLHGKCRGCGFLWREQVKDADSGINPGAAPVGARLESGAAVVMGEAGPVALGRRSEA